MCWQLARDCQIPSLSRRSATDGWTVGGSSTLQTEPKATYAVSWTDVESWGSEVGGVSKRLSTDGCAVHLKHLLRVRGRNISSSEQTLLNSFFCNKKTPKIKVIYVLQIDGHVIGHGWEHWPFFCVSRCRLKRSAVVWETPGEKERKERKTFAASPALNAVFLKSPAKRRSPRRTRRHFNSIYPPSAPFINHELLGRLLSRQSIRVSRVPSEVRVCEASGTLQ